MTILFVMALALLGLFMKLAALLVPGTAENARWSFLLSPLPSPVSLNRPPRFPSLAPQLLRALIFGAMLASFCWVYWQLVRSFNLRGVLLKAW